MCILYILLLFRVLREALREHFELTAQSSVFQLIFRLRCEEIEAIAHAIEPIVIGRRATFRDPAGIGGSDVKDDFGEQAVTTGEDVTLVT
jgi:hypothetical protein